MKFQRSSIDLLDLDWFGWWVIYNNTNFSNESNTLEIQKSYILLINLVSELLIMIIAKSNVIYFDVTYNNICTLSYPHQ